MMQNNPSKSKLSSQSYDLYQLSKEEFPRIFEKILND
jgi:hypothetical protein